jgi:ABC-type phosphate transport system substrate-binding protein
MPAAILFLLAATVLRSSLPSERFAVIVHETNPTTGLRVAELNALFSGEARRWRNGSRVVLVERDSDSAGFKFLLHRLLNMSPTQYKRSLANIEFKGEEPAIVKVLNSGPAACRFVFNVPGAIGLVEATSLSSPECQDVRVIRVEGKLPGDEGYPLQ